MNPRVILVSYRNPDQDQAALEYAFNLAEIYDARVEGWHISPNPENAFSPYAVYGAIPVYPDSALREMEKVNEENRKAAKLRFTATAKNVKDNIATFHTATGSSEYILAEMGRVADLIILARTDENVSYTNAINGALFGSGRPVLLIPPEKDGQKFNGKILIAWNGSREAARAVSSSLPYLMHNTVSILTDQEGEDIQPSAEDLKKYLNLHEIKAKILPYMDEGSPLGAAILNTARMIDAGMIVMGGWSHSRVREYILGGVTDYMLHHADVPVFMVH